MLHEPDLTELHMAGLYLYMDHSVLKPLEASKNRMFRGC